MQVLPLCSYKENRTCNDMIPDRWSCEDLEERSSRPRSGCRKNRKCEGCRHCVCFVCEM
ncbi:putative developmental regulator, ULTRAPETALA [Helianthus annuus]|nr:putative developmental regulator, ULTRAPETALA [Helianthus annuus]